MAGFVQLKPGRLHIPAEQGILKGRDHVQYTEARQILAAAQEQAQSIIEDARRAHEEEKRRGYEEGLEEARLENAERMMEMVGTTIDYFSNVEQEMAGVVISAVRKILGEFDGDELTLRVVRNALQLVRNQRQLVLRVSPQEVEAIKARIHEILAEYAAIGFVDVTGDHRLHPGGCILESEMGVIDAGIDVQLKALKSALANRLGAGKAEAAT